MLPLEILCGHNQHLMFNHRSLGVGTLCRYITYVPSMMRQPLICVSAVNANHEV